MLVKACGIIVRETVYGESDKYVTLLTKEYGKISVLCRGVRNYKNKNSGCINVLCYNEFILYRSRGDSYTLKEASVIEGFYSVRDDIVLYSAAMYMCDVASEICVESESDEHEEALSLLLNSLYLLGKKRHETDMIKAVYELRMASISGFMPDLRGCSDCGKFDGDYIYLDVMNGTLICSECFEKRSDGEEKYTEDGTSFIMLPLSASVLCAMRFVIYSEPKKIFSFSLTDDEMYDFSSVCEKYLLNQIENGFTTLDFYKQVKQTDKIQKNV